MTEEIEPEQPIFTVDEVRDIFVTPDDMVEVPEPKSLSDQIYDAIVHSDCYCKPGDPTCEDWPDSVTRWKALHKGVMRVLTEENVLVTFFGEPEQSNLVDHARRELELIGEDADVIDGYLKVIRAFADMGHSGGSAMVAIPVINMLLQFKNLRPLTNDPDEWIHHTEETWGEPGGIWQNSRNSEAFSNDGGNTYYLLSEGGNDRNPYPLHKAEEKGNTDG